MINSQPLSYDNQFVLNQIAFKIKSKHLNHLFEQEEMLSQNKTGFLSRIWEHVTSPWAIGENIGWLIGSVHSHEIANDTVEKFVLWAFADKIAAERAAAQASVGLNQKIYQWIKCAAVENVAQTGIVEASKLAFTPKVAPFITVALGIVGGIAVTAIFSLGEFLFHKIFRRKPNVEIGDLDIKALNRLVSIKEDQIFFGKEAMNQKDLENINRYLNQYFFCQKLQRMDASEIEEFIYKRLNLNDVEKGFSEKKVKKIQKGINALKAKNISRDYKKIRTLTKKLAKYADPIIQLNKLNNSN